MNCLDQLKSLGYTHVLLQKQITLNDFEILHLIGEGSFGKVPLTNSFAVILEVDLYNCRSSKCERRTRIKSMP